MIVEQHVEKKFLSYYLKYVFLHLHLVVETTV